MSWIKSHEILAKRKMKCEKEEKAEHYKKRRKRSNCESCSASSKQFFCIFTSKQNASLLLGESLRSLKCINVKPTIERISDQLES